MTYATPNDTTIWQYADYKQVGQGTDGKMAFQTLLKVTGSVASPVPTSEEEDYAYDTSGRVESAAFAQTPASGFSPGSGQRWYSVSEEPASRCREFFDFDPAGRNLNFQYMWETFNPTSTSPTSVNNITGWNYTYENSGQARGLKLTSSLYNGSGTSWNLDHTENYGYEAQRGFLTSAQYNDGQPNAYPTWTYDESQNRGDVTTNNLNQVTIGGNPVTDLAGRTLTRGSATLAWDSLSRLTSYTSGSNVYNYEYRADGMRDHRHVPGTTATEWSYYDDGQTTAEDEQIQGAALTVTRYGLGARGIDECERQTGTYSGGTHTLTSSTSVWYPVYDGHGNQCGTLSRSGANSFSLQNVRTFDVWGNLRRGAQSGDPASRYCGSIGHVQDDESGLVYMRARYYDCSSGRFICEDQSQSGKNWCVYCSNNPVDCSDTTGKFTTPGIMVWMLFLYSLYNASITIPRICDAADRFGQAVAAATDSGQVEGAWGDFMSVWSSGIITGDAGTAIGCSGFGAGQANGAAAELGGDFIPGLGEIGGAIVGGTYFAAKMDLLCGAYNLRIEWYIQDIDN